VWFEAAGRTTAEESQRSTRCGPRPPGPRRAARSPPRRAAPAPALGVFGQRTAPTAHTMPHRRTQPGTAALPDPRASRGCGPSARAAAGAARQAGRHLRAPAARADCGDSRDKAQGGFPEEQPFQRRCEPRAAPRGGQTEPLEGQRHHPAMPLRARALPRGAVDRASEQAMQRK
jgi:hypothetical protein